MSMPVERIERAIAVAAPPITIEVFESFLQCETKSKLYFQGAAETDSEFKKWHAASVNLLKKGAYLGSAPCAEKMTSMLELHLSKPSNESIGELSQITSPPPPRYVLTSMRWNLRQRLQIRGHRFIDHFALYQARN